MSWIPFKSEKDAPVAGERVLVTIDWEHGRTVVEGMWYPEEDDSPNEKNIYHSWVTPEYTPMPDEFEGCKVLAWMEYPKPFEG